MENLNISTRDLCARLIRGSLLIFMFLHSATAAEDINITIAPQRTLNFEQLRDLEVKDGAYHPERVFHFNSPNLDVVVVVAEAGNGIVRQRISLYSKSDANDRLWHLKSVVWAAAAYARIKLIDDKQAGECIVVRDKDGNMLAQFSLHLMGLYSRGK